MEQEKCVCPSQISWSLDNFVRKWIHNPHKIFSKYIRDGMTILDLGCGPGFFIASFAELAGVSGRVIAADLQEKMLEKVRRKINGTRFEYRILLHKCSKDAIGLDLKVDFVNAFYMIHEVPDGSKLIQEIYSILNPGGLFFFCEPKFHVSKDEFAGTVRAAEDMGFKIIDQPDIFMSRTAVFVKE
jgi:ubiquinone/menaquinone biosynthesis C-methylase UbiE